MSDNDNPTTASWWCGWCQTTVTDPHDCELSPHRSQIRIVSQTTAKPLPAPIHIIAALLDHPNVYMGGPSRPSIRRAERIWEVLKEEGYVKDA